ncbi:MAG: DsbA family protein [Nitrospirae bacterium]|nr:DsbA family protein [Nitrospirota bacterium]
MMEGKKVFLFLSLCLLVAIPGLVLSAVPKIEGTYLTIPGKKFQSDGKTVEVVEFLSFYCSHCYEFERSIPVIKGNFPKKVRWKVVPIYWGKGSPKPGEAYLLAEEAGKGEAMKTALFHANFIQRQDIGKVEVLEKLGADIGLGFDFSARLRSGEKAKAVEAALEMSKAYGVNETPTLVIAGNLLVSPSMSPSGGDGFTENVKTILKSLLR